jgi:4-hydroxy-3-methylbut-2-enyl diphosphate reductase
MGQAPRAVHLVGDADEARRVEVPDTAKVAYLTQTTLSVDETAGVVDVLRERFPVLTGPRSDDICYATQNRQNAVKALVEECELVLVIGAENSSNSKRLVEVARDRGRAAHLIAEAAAVDPAWFDGVGTVGVTSGASAPEWLVDELIEALRQRGATEVRELSVVDEDVHFALPGALRRDAEARTAGHDG